MKYLILRAFTLFANIVVLLLLCYLYVFPPEITTTELIHKYKNYVITQKYEFNDNYFIRVKNPYKINLIHKPLIVPSGVYYNFSVGDTIGKKKQTYLNIY